MTLSWDALHLRCQRLPEPFRTMALDVYRAAKMTHEEHPGHETKILYELDGEVESFEWDAAFAIGGSGQ